MFKDNENYLFDAISKLKSFLINSQNVKQMRPISIHIKSITAVFNQLMKGNFLIYFVPGILVTIVYFITTSTVSSILSPVRYLDDVPLIGAGVSGIANFFGYMGQQIYIFFILTILSPFNTYLSEKLDSKLTGQTFESGLARIINDFIRMIFIVIIAITLEFGFLIFWWMISWIFGFLDSAIYDLVTFLMSSFFFGFSFYDHSLERYDKGVFSTVGFAFSNMLLVTLTGAIFNVLYLFPFTLEFQYIGIVISPVITTMIATVCYLYLIKKMPLTKDVNPSQENG